MLHMWDTTLSHNKNSLFFCHSCGCYQRVFLIKEKEFAEATRNIKIKTRGQIVYPADTRQIQVGPSG